MSEDKPQYKQSMGLAAETALVHIMPSEELAETWKQEAKDNGFSSRSKYLFVLIEEARRFRDHELANPSRAEHRIDELQAEIEQLEQKLQKTQQAASGSVTVDDPEFVKQFLTENYQELPAVVQRVVESGALNDLLRKPVEDQLYYLATQGEVEYERGWGWKLAEGEE
ncbi:hypothetical protein G3I44_14030 [Halogeometricum borinquense]|uniref:Uncharacterized protein n=1 Tax=Halogeometricum borinquense TaxID=60847 RepID=A0A6C0UIG0_9EURY|nr:hypothetical protein [Halogeometricum borinquense]QIB75306.1 hypothetical protein G3I44_14030 [Halogeometricum borinquense]